MQANATSWQKNIVCYIKNVPSEFSLSGDNLVGTFCFSLLQKQRAQDNERKKIDYGWFIKINACKPMQPLDKKT